MKYQKINFTLSNSKLGGFVPSLDLPPIITCRKNAPCAKGCYALKGRFMYKQKRACMQANLEAYRQNNGQFFEEVIDFLNNNDISYKFFRWFGAGDIVDTTFLFGMVHVAVECPNTKFLAFTKKYELVNDYLNVIGELPSNLHIVFSMWDKDFKVDNPYNLPTAYVDFKNKECNPTIPEFAIPCQGNCASCKSCWSLVKNQSVFFKQH